MKNLLCLMLGVVWAFSFQSCSKDNENNSAWREANEAAFDVIVNNPKEYTKLDTPQGGPGIIYYKEIVKGTGTVSPLFTSKVKVNYKGTYYDGTVFDQNVEGIPAIFYTEALVPGFYIALQNMVVGDKWEVWIPWSLGYGAYGNGTIPGYSTLVFEVELVGIDQNY